MARLAMSSPLWERAEAIDTSSVYAVLATALPSSLIAEALTNSAAVASELASEFSAGSTPSWFEALPTGIQNYLLGSTTSQSNVPSSRSSQQSSDHSSLPAQSPTYSSPATSSAMPSPASSSMSPPMSTTTPSSIGTQSSGSQASNTLSALFPNAGASTSTSTDPPAGPSNGTPTGAIAGGVVGGVAVLALVGAGVAFFLRRRKRRQRIEPMREVSIHPGGNTQRHRNF